MIRLVSPPPPAEGRAAYPVPWVFDRSLAHPRFALENAGTEVLHAISLHLLGSGTLLRGAPVTMRPGDRIVLSIRDADLARNTILLVRWYRPDGTDYLWRVSF